MLRLAKGPDRPGAVVRELEVPPEWDLVHVSILTHLSSVNVGADPFGRLMSAGR